ncbi:hypothetical protein FHX82_006767 [Amycolatopsis bartoniae]|uniref:Cytochrome P450 n=1 Tax=Amycolatopsis bartoniae TaxID=941986 RepID=A0A8H9IQB2_9PSEU|nr:cytochrome P450 [Amycolatopsis bartoniae]MBB2939681.1 hypothetical protein [Amycolatopsis bartoniae]TVT06198.1 cytochrome P450 [Amycolatopsis bartoniae]GHF36545.1 cytochrome P450 [Amycolatopsis bartoniae]
MNLPAELVRDYDHVSGPEIMDFPPAAADRMRDAGPAFWSTAHGGFWVVTRFEDARAAFQDPELFPQWGRGMPENPFSRTYIPLNLNPPEHHAYRKALVPLLSPRRVRALEEVVRETARRQLAKIGPKGECEFVEDFAMTLPAAMFCGLLGLPLDEFSVFADMAFDLIYAPAKVGREEGMEAAKAHRARANKKIEDFMRDLLARRKEEPGDDMISFLLGQQVHDRPLTDEEVFNISTLMFFAGTDSTGSAIAYSFAFLAQHPEHRQQLLDDPSIAPRAADELLRYHGFHHITRQVSRDTEFAGVPMRKGDVVLLPTGGANRDPEQFEDPNTVDFSRKASHHLTFGAGPHRCVGAPLATLELKVALEEVHKVITDYRIGDAGIEYVSGQSKTIPQRLPMVYTPVSSSVDAAR